jgi:release factor glutamine methyltransferase
VRFLQSDWFCELKGERFDLIVANPPYVAADDAHLSRGDLRYEPAFALADGSADGLGSIERICHAACAHLEHGGWLWLEHGWDQAGRVRRLMRECGLLAVHSRRDLAGILRSCGGRL